MCCLIVPSSLDSTDVSSIDSTDVVIAEQDFISLLQYKYYRSGTGCLKTASQVFLLHISTKPHLSMYEFYNFVFPLILKEYIAFIKYPEK